MRGKWKYFLRGTLIGLHAAMVLLLIVKYRSFD